MNKLLPFYCAILFAIIIAEVEGSSGDEITENLTIINESAPVGWFLAGEALYNESKYNESLYAYSKAIELNGSYAEAWQRKGRTLRRLGEYDASIVAYERAIELAPKLGIALGWQRKHA